MMHLSALAWSVSVGVTVVAALPPAWNGQSAFNVQGTSGVSAMQLAVTSEDEVLIVDRIEANDLQIDGHPAWAATLQLSSGQLTPKPLQTNTFCASGSYLSNGTLAIVGGDPFADYGAVGGDSGGYNGIRLYNSWDGSMFEDHEHVHLDKKRWYPGTSRLSDGSMIVVGGTDNNINYNLNPTYEFYPAKGDGLSIQSQFLVDAAPDELFPHVMPLDEDHLFVAANRKSMILNWKTHEERYLPDFPNNVVVTCELTPSTDPYGSAAALLPLSPANNYTAEVLFCGGTSMPPGEGAWSGTPSTRQCSRMVLDEEGIAGGWQLEDMPEGSQRIMGNAIMMPDNTVLFINGAGTGAAGYYDEQKGDLGFSAADNPALEPVLYDPRAPAGQRFTKLGVTAQVPRLYHSSASLLPDGRIITAGSNPNPYRVDDGEKFPTEYRLEYLSPPYMNITRPALGEIPARLDYNEQFKVPVDLTSGYDAGVTASLLDLGYSTHGYQYNSRMVYLNAEVVDDGTALLLTAPPTTGVFPPGPAWLFITANGIPSQGRKLDLGSGASPPQQ